MSEEGTQTENQVDKEQTNLVKEDAEAKDLSGKEVKAGSVPEEVGGEAKPAEEKRTEETKPEEEKPKFKFERDYVVPLQRVYWLGRNKRAKRAVRLLKQFVSRHTKAERVIIENAVNEVIWARGIKKPPRRISIHIGVTDDKKAYVYLKK